MATDFDKLVGSRIRYYRILRGYSQIVLAQELGVTFQQMQKYERGKNRVSIETAKRLKTFLAITWEDLIGETEIVVAPVLVSDRRTASLVSLFSMLAPTQKKAIFAFVRDLAKAAENGGNGAA